MCEQCVVEALLYKTPLVEKPTYYVFKAMRDGSVMQKGEYGIVISNDPDFIFTLGHLEKYDPDTIDDEANFDKYRVVIEFSQKFMPNTEEFNSVFNSYQLMKAYIEQYDIPKDWGQMKVLTHLRNTLIDIVTGKVFSDETPDI